VTRAGVMSTALPRAGPPHGEWPHACSNLSSVLTDAKDDLCEFLRKTICGLRPATLKDLFAKNDFSTLRAAKKLGMDVRSGERDADCLV
jgi:hypothetical protein